MQASHGPVKLCALISGRQFRSKYLKYLTALDSLLNIKRAPQSRSNSLFEKYNICVVVKSKPNMRKHLHTANHHLLIVSHFLFVRS